MATDNVLPPHTDYLLSYDKVVSYLVAAKNNRWCEGAFRMGADGFLVVLPGDKRINLRCYGNTCSVWPDRVAFGVGHQQADSVATLETAMSWAVSFHGLTWPTRQTSVRLKAGAPATNLATISGLVGTAEVEAVFDPYLNNHALGTLLNILSFGASVSNSLRLLASEKQARGASPRLTKTYVEDWFKERGVTAAEARLMPDGEHRRFILLNGGQSLILGMSLNCIDKNEAVRLEPDAADRAFFDGVWAGATPLS